VQGIGDQYRPARGTPNDRQFRWLQGHLDDSVLHQIAGEDRPKYPRRWRLSRTFQVEKGPRLTRADRRPVSIIGGKAAGLHELEKPRQTSKVQETH